jgi:Na+/H+ antiporter NhaC
MKELIQLLPLSVPFVAIVLAFVTKKVPFSLLIGVLYGLLLLGLSSPATYTEHISSLIKEVFLKGDNLKIVAFTAIISLMVGLMAKAGSISDVAKYLVKFARDRKSAQLMTFLSGLAIFFDDYANTFIVGNTFRPITDQYKVTREKLAYIVDSTAAPVAAVALVSSWVGYEVKQIGNAMGDHLAASPYSYFLNSLAYSYYPFFTLMFVLITILTGREFGPMLKAKPTISSNFHDINVGSITGWQVVYSLLPMLALLFFSFATMLYTGYFNLEQSTSFGLREIIGASNSVDSLLTGSIAGFLLVNLQHRKKLFDKKYLPNLKKSLSKIKEPILILFMAWALGFVITHLEIASIIMEFLPSDTSPYILPGLIFIFASIISFSTGSSFSTMGIVFPIVLPIVFKICLVTGFSLEMGNQVLYHAIACVLAGSVFGDHCSPISDTTILSSIASECNHLAHVNTQMPYALTVGAFSLFVSLTLANMMLPWYIVFAIGGLVLYLVIRVFGRTYR